MDLIKSISVLKDLRGELKDIDKRIVRLKNESEKSENKELIIILQDRIDYAELRRSQIHSELNKLQQVIDQADISVKERRILTLYYIDGYSWQQVAFRIGESDEQIPRRIRNRLLRRKTNVVKKVDEKDEK